MGILFRWLYSILFTLLLPVVMLRMLLRSRKAPEYRQRWAERFGFHRVPEEFQNGLWFHAVSLGETLAAAPVIEHMLKQEPDLPIVLTNMTPTGSAEARKRFGDRVYNCYLPYDLPYLLKPFIRSFNPKALIIIETELWPNLIHCAHKLSVKTLLANARLSERSAKGYQKILGLVKPMLQTLDGVAVQNLEDEQRFLALGLAPEKSQVLGSVKYDIEIAALTEQKAQKIRQENWPSKKVLIAASTHQGEDKIILNAFKAVKAAFPSSILLLAPRHPERFNEVAELTKQQGFSLTRRSDENLRSTEDVLLIDSLGELLTFYGAADVAVVGGSFIEHGGHNPIEPAAWGLPTLMGQSQFNFRDICQQLEANKGLITVQNHQLANEVLSLFKDSNKAHTMGFAGQKVVNQNRGAVKKLVELIEDKFS